MTIPVIQMVNPAEVIIESNVRTRVDLDQGFVSSIRERGIITEPIGWVDDDGQVHVVIGQRRVAAAVQLGLGEIPVKIRSRHDAEADRVFDQLVENDRRQPLTTAERVAAWSTLFELGVPADQVAKRTGSKRDAVRSAKKLLEEAPATAADLQTHHQVTLDQLAEIAEFEAHADLRAMLYEAAETEPDKFPHRIAEARDEVSRRNLLAEEIAALAAEGIEYLAKEDMPDQYEWDQLAALEEVYLPDLPAPAEVSVERAKEQGGLVASLYWGHAWNGKEYKSAWRRFYFIESPREHGYLDGEDNEIDETKTDEEEGLERERTLRALEEQKAQRAAQARAWELADQVRQEWIRDALLNDRVKLPKGTGMVILDGWLRGGGVLPRHSSYSGAAELGAELLGLSGSDAKISNPEQWMPDEKAAQFDVLRDLAHGIGHERVLLGLVLGRMEKSFTLDRVAAAASYLTLLETWGYGLSDVEAEFVAQAAAPAPAASVEACSE